MKDNTSIDSESVIFKCFLYTFSFNLSVTLLKIAVDIDHIRGQEEVNRCLKVKEKEKIKKKCRNTRHIEEKLNTCYSSLFCAGDRHVN